MEQFNYIPGKQCVYNVSSPIQKVYITITEVFETVHNVIAYLNSLPGYYRDEVIEVRTYDGWKPQTFKWAENSFERI